MQDTNNDGEESLGCFLDFVLGMLTYASIFLLGFYFMLEWGWVIVPVFHVGKLSFWSATGVLLVVKYLTSRSSSASDLKKSRSTRYSEFGLDLASDTMALFIIWIVSLGI